MYVRTCSNSNPTVDTAYPRGPEVLAREVSFFTAHAGNSDGTLPFQKPDHRSYRVLGWNGDAHVHMVWHQMPLNDLAFLLLGQRVEDRTQLPTSWAKYCLPSPFGHEYDMILAVPFGMG